MENNQTIIELYNIYLELGHEVFEEKIKFYLHNNHVCGSTNSLNTFIANAKENLKLGEVCFDEYDIFSPPSLEEKIYFDDTMSPIYDDYNDVYDIFSPPTIEDESDLIEFDDPLCSLDDKSLCGDSIQNYVVMFNFNACNYYERGRDKNPLYVSMLFKMQAFDYYMHWLPQICCYLFIYKIPMHRKRVRLKSKLFNIPWCVPYALISYSV
jgi:hypothetical protein